MAMKRIAPGLSQWVSFWIQKEGREGYEVKNARAELRALKAVAKAAAKAFNEAPNDAVCRGEMNYLARALERLDKVSGRNR